MRPIVLVAVAACALTAVAAASAGVPRSIQGTSTRRFGIQDFKQPEEAPSGTYTMKITPTLLVWTARGLGRSIEQIKLSGRMIEVATSQAPTAGSARPRRGAPTASKRPAGASRSPR